MSTRTNIKISIAGSPPIYLYRHHDGYPAYAGADVLRLATVKRLRWGACDCANRFLKDADAVYELTEQAHGDIKHFYEIMHVPGTEQVLIRHAEGYGAALEHDLATYTREQFAKLVNAERTNMNARMVILAEKHPAIYKDCEPLEMVAA